MSEPRWGRHPIIVVMALRAMDWAVDSRTERRSALAQWFKRPISRSVSTAGFCLGLGKWAQATDCQSRGG
eukprot:539053-Lingulodinium_polyedra.AAC.1